MSLDRLLFLIACFLPLALVGCPAEEPAADDDATADDDDSAVDDDDSASDDDDATNEDIPVYLASFDFSLIMLQNDPYGVYDQIDGQMDVSVSTTQFLAELTTDTGDVWSWSGDLLENQTAFEVRGYFRPPGAADDVYSEINGNFMANADQTVSQVCLNGLGVDDDPNYPNQGIRFVWYGCQVGAGPPQQERTGVYNVSVTVHGDNCGGVWSPAPPQTLTWTETWNLAGRRLVVTRPNPAGGTYTATGVISDDGNVFSYTYLEQQSPGRVLKVLGDFTNPTNTTEGRANGFCHDNVAPPAAGGVIDYDFP